MAGKEQICRLCLNVPTNSFQEMNFTEESMLKFVRLDLYMCVIESPIICSQCSETLQQSYEFKMVCRKTENFLNRVYDRKKKTKLDLKYILLSNNEDKNEGVCRFCLGYLKTDSSVCLDKLNEDIFLKDMVHKCLPEFNLEITEQPTMCLECSENLQTVFNFMMVCQDNDEKIKKKVAVNGVDSRGLVSLSDVLKFVDDMNNDDVKPLDEEAGIAFVKVETIEVEMDDTLDTVPSVETDNEIDDEFEETKEDFSQKITSKGETSQLEVMKGDKSKKSKRKSPSKAKARKGKLKKDRKKTKRTVQATTTQYHCAHCNLTVHRQAALISHLRKVHRDTCCIHQCDRCDFVTVYPDELHTHQSQSFHSKYMCDECGFISYRRNQWIAHRQAHRIAKCKVCSRTFSRQMYLDGHILTHHPGHESLIVNKVWRCEACGFKTVHKADWLPHKCQEIVRYHCQHCDFSTPFSICLEKHRDIMHKYTCEVCERKFGRKPEFTRHVKGHTLGEEYDVLIKKIDEITGGGG